MKETFKNFYSHSKEEFEDLWSNCLFVFDANIILNLYRYSDLTRLELLNIFNLLKDRIWLPHQVALEFHSNRISVILGQKDSYNKISTVLGTVSSTSISEFDQKLKDYKKKHPNIDIEDVSKKIHDFFSDLINDLKMKEEEHPDLMNKDIILDEITNLFNGKIGPSYEQKRLDEIFKEGESRYLKKIPPGYSDLKEKKDKYKYFNQLEIKEEYGDLIVWKQIIDKAKEEKIPIIFVTDDNKEDWWYKTNGKTIGARTELINEFNSFTNHIFYMYQQDRFIEYAQSFLNLKVTDDAILEIKDFIKSDEEIIDDFLLGNRTEFEIYNSDFEYLNIDELDINEQKFYISNSIEEDHLSRNNHIFVLSRMNKIISFLFQDKKIISVDLVRTHMKMEIGINLSKSTIINLLKTFFNEKFVFMSDGNFIVKINNK